MLSCTEEEEFVLNLAGTLTVQQFIYLFNMQDFELSKTCTQREIPTMYANKAQPYGNI